MTRLTLLLLPVALLSAPLAADAQDWRTERAFRRLERGGTEVFWEGNCKVEQRLSRSGALLERRTCDGPGPGEARDERDDARRQPGRSDDDDDRLPLARGDDAPRRPAVRDDGEDERRPLARAPYPGQSDTRRTEPDRTVLRQPSYAGTVDDNATVLAEPAPAPRPAPTRSAAPPLPPRAVTPAHPVAALAPALSAPRLAKPLATAGKAVPVPAAVAKAVRTVAPQRDIARAAALPRRAAPQMSPRGTAIAAKPAVRGDAAKRTPALASTRAPATPVRLLAAAPVAAKHPRPLPGPSIAAKRPRPQAGSRPASVAAHAPVQRRPALPPPAPHTVAGNTRPTAAPVHAPLRPTQAPAARVLAQRTLPAAPAAPSVIAQHAAAVTAAPARQAAAPKAALPEAAPAQSEEQVALKKAGTTKSEWLVVLQPQTGGMAAAKEAATDKPHAGAVAHHALSQSEYEAYVARKRRDPYSNL